ncbi:hypothetical protein V9T40_007048 [Parthenolecanium corni]|uniref:Uncharacterized protein n=1 Tax=Parthenolecanium corni TaxID=536013 RepID=A0AAN9TU78_9HEMI
MQSFKIAAILLVAFAAYASAKDGYVSVNNNGGYVAAGQVQYDYNGSRQSESFGDFSLGVTKSIRIPDGATNIYVKVEEYWFINSLSTIFTESFATPPEKCYKIWGTTLNPKYSTINC